jgi:hypothetical protein
MYDEVGDGDSAVLRNIVDDGDADDEDNVEMIGGGL